MIELLKNPWHGHSQDTEFCGPDSREVYEHNLRIQPSDWPWRTQTVRYSLNSQGYRCPEFDSIDWAESVIMFGCSYTFGCGLDDSQTMTHLLSKQLGRPVINLGAGATDDLFQFVNTNILYNNGVRPYAVIYLWPGVNRLTELKGTRETWNWGSWNASTGHNISKYWITNETHCWEFLRYLSMSVRNLWTCPVLEFYPYMYRPEHFGTILPWGNVRDQARDLLRSGAYHPGPATVEYLVAEYVMPELIKLGVNRR